MVETSKDWLSSLCQTSGKRLAAPVREFRFQLGGKTVSHGGHGGFLGSWQLICCPVVERDGKRL
jgi:hypothetical protein